MIYIPCECHTEGIVVQHDDECNTFNISFVANSKHAFQMNWWERIKTACKLIVSGRMYVDQVIINKQSAAHLINHLVKYDVKISKTHD